MQIGLLSSLYNLLHAHGTRIITVLDILCDTAGEQHRLLGYDANLRPQEGHADARRWTSIDQLEQIRERQVCLILQLQFLVCF